MNKKTIRMLIGIPTGIALLISLIFFENIKGYFRFQWYCSNEGGLKVYEKLEKNVGWISKDKHDARVIAQQNHIGFSLYKDKEGNLVNVIYKNGNPSSFKSYDFVQYDGGNDPRYEYKRSHERLNRNEEIRLYKGSYVVVDRKSGNPAIQFSKFAYSFFDKNNVLLASPGGRSGCHKYHEFFEGINSNFKD